MKIIEIGVDPNTGAKRYRVDMPIWIPGVNGNKGRGSHLRRIAVGSGDLATKISELKQIAGGSLTCKTFEDCSAYYKKHVGYKTKTDVFVKNQKGLGRYRIDHNFPARYYDYIFQIAQGRAVNTVNNYRICIRSVLNFCAGKIISNNPIKDFRIERRVERDRVWSDSERTRIFNTMATLKSHLYLPLLLAEKNPIRKMDLVNLRVSDLVLFGEGAPYIRFFPSKTRSRQNRPTLLIELSDELLDALKAQIIAHPDCPWLFPRLRTNAGDKTAWQYIGNPKTAWRHICELANVHDFHFHDLRHVATTYMMDKRDAAGQRVYDEDDLKSLGLFYSTQIMELYRNRRAELVIERVRHSTFIAPKSAAAI